MVIRRATFRVAGFSNRLAEVDTVRIGVDEFGRVGLPAGIPGGAALQGQAVQDARNERCFDAANSEVLSIGAESQVSRLARVEEADLHVVPVLLVNGTVP